MTDVIDRTDVNMYRTATTEEKHEANVPGYLWMGISDSHVPSNVVGAGVFVDALRESRQAKDQIAGAAEWLQIFARENQLSEDNPAEITLSQVNVLLNALGRERITGVTEYTFCVTVSYEVSGSIFCKDEDTARGHIDELVYAMSDPDINEPILGDDDEEWYGVSAEYSDHDIIDVSEA